MKQLLTELRNKVLYLRNTEELSVKGELILLHKLNALEKQFAIHGVSNSSEHKERIEAYKECFETYIPNNKWDEATLFLSTYGSGLAKELAKKQL